MKNRIIKFRAWDKIEKTMNCARTGMQIAICFENPKRFELMEYTGIKDKNGKEIYEGDIIEFPALLDGDKKGRAKVFFQDGCFIGNGVLWKSDLLEVVGNIYENPELLGGTLTIKEMEKLNIMKKQFLTIGNIT